MQPTPSGTGYDYPAPKTSSAGRPWTIAGFVCAALAFLFVPIVLGPLGAIFGFIGNAKGDPLGKWAGILGIVATVVGIALAAALVGSRT